MLHELITMWPRPRGNGWFKEKVHEQLHVPRDITRNGTPRESFGGPLEHNHMPIKALAQRTQCHCETYDIQLAKRLAESYIINQSMARMLPQQTTPEKLKTSNKTGLHPNAAQGSLTFFKNYRPGMSDSPLTMEILLYTFQTPKCQPL